jgi:putative membrane protein
MNFKQILFKIAINTISVFIVAWMLSGIHLENIFTAIAVAVVLALLNTFLRPILIFLTFQITAITMGLFLLVINAGIVMLAGKMIPGFDVATFWTAFWFGILMPIVSFFLGLPEKIRQQQVIFRRMTGTDTTSTTTVESPFFDTKTWVNGESQDFQDAEIVEEDE